MNIAIAFRRATTSPIPRFLRQAHQAVAPSADPTVREEFARSIGKARLFPDCPALVELRRSVRLGCISNCDFRHQQDVQEQLGFVWDVCIVAEDLRDYKPKLSAWEKIVQSMTRDRGYQLSEWLHVAAYVDYDLGPAKELGVQTCFMPRPGGSPAREAELLGTDVMVSDLNQLQAGVVQSHGDPLCYRVKAKFEHEKLARHFARWMRDEHAGDMFEHARCAHISVVDCGEGEIEANYYFANETDYKRYLDTHADKMRGKGLATFPEQIANFARQLGKVKLYAERR